MISRVSPFISGNYSSKGVKASAQIMSYSPTEFYEKENFYTHDLGSVDNGSHIIWLNLHSTEDLAFIKAIGDRFQLDLLTLDKIIDVEQRPKMEEFDSYLFLSLKTLWVNADDEIETEQISFVLGTGFLLSFQEKKADLFEEVRNRIRLNMGIVRNKRGGYLLYLMLTAIVDNYIRALDYLRGKIDLLDTEVVQERQDDALVRIEYLKQELAEIKRNLSPLRDVVSSLHNGESAILLPETVRFVGNIRDQIISILEEVETQRHVLDGLTNIHLTNLNNKMNEVMKVLTVISTIFIPLTFIAGIYGMNFQYMPELTFRYGYFIALGAMLVIFVGMLFYFRSKKWF
ncbi:MAG: magnesium/cobalt transporter CorA [Flavobacteriales bacterium]|nr:magnesium/cobalt transporter CorA [Flavobacteriales bacterium]